MTNRERFAAIMNYQPFDRLPVWYFGTWRETAALWAAEGVTRDQIPAATGMDPDWEGSLWDCQGIVLPRPVFPGREVVLEETDAYRVVQHASGAVDKVAKGRECIPQHLRHALVPTADDWQRFAAALDPADPARWLPNWPATCEALRDRSPDRVVAACGASLFGWPRDWMGIEQLSYLPYDDPELLGEILTTITDFYIAIHRRWMRQAELDFVYIFEDCCGRSGPLLSPATFRAHFLPHYQRLIRFFKQELAVPFVLLDSDGMIDPLIPCWLDAGVDILFPIEVGTWHADPVALRRRFGRRLRMMGGFDKHLIAHGGEPAIRAELERLAPLVAEGGFIPLPDHRIPPDCTLAQFRTYVRVFKEVFGGVAVA